MGSEASKPVRPGTTPESVVGFSDTVLSPTLAGAVRVIVVLVVGVGSSLLAFKRISGRRSHRLNA